MSPALAFRTTSRPSAGTPREPSFARTAFASSSPATKAGSGRLSGGTTGSVGKAAGGKSSACTRLVNVRLVWRWGL